MVNDIVNDVVNEKPRRATMPPLNGSTTPTGTLFAADDASTESSDGDYVDMDTMLSTPHNVAKVGSVELQKDIFVCID